MSRPFKLKYKNSAFPFKSPLKDGDHTSKEYYEDSEHFMRHNREAMAKEEYVRGVAEKGLLNQPKPKLAKTLGDIK